MRFIFLLYELRISLVIYDVEIDDLERRNVKKPSGARPGFVNYFHQHTLYVTPSLDEIAPYRVREDL